MASPASRMLQGTFVPVEPPGFRPVRKRQAPSPCPCCAEKTVKVAKKYFDESEMELLNILEPEDSEVAKITTHVASLQRSSKKPPEKKVVFEDTHMTIRLVPKTQ